MTVLVVGASGATGKHVVEQLLLLQQTVKVIVRPSSSLAEDIKNHPRITLIKANIAELSAAEIAAIIQDCSAIVSCLGHNLTFKGIFGQPRLLVKDSVRSFCQAVQADPSNKPLKFVLMNTTGNSNRDLIEPISFAQKMVMALLRLLLPPHVDNEKAADFLRIDIGQNNKAIEWVAVRPDGLTNENNVSPYSLHASPTRSAIFDAGVTSRINVGHFIATLVTDPELWQKWQGKMPVIYNK